MRANFWRPVTAGWIGLIFFSSTAVAGRWSEDIFQTLAALMFGPLLQAGGVVSKAAAGLGLSRQAL